LEVSKAQSQGCSLVSEAFVTDCIKAKKRLPVAKYDLEGGNISANSRESVPTVVKKSSSTKRVKPQDDEDEDEKTTKQSKNRKRKKQDEDDENDVISMDDDDSDDDEHSYPKWYWAGDSKGGSAKVSLILTDSFGSSLLVFFFPHHK